MSNPRRSLPPPVAMTRGQPPPPLLPVTMQPSSLSQPLAQIAPPQQWQGTECTMHDWLQAKVEEDKKKQEEEKTRQEGLRLEQRRIEQDMLRTSLQGGIPPHMVPMIFAGMGAAHLPSPPSVAHAHTRPHQQFPPPQAIPARGGTSPEPLRRRDARASGPSYVESHQAGSAPHPDTQAYAMSPTSRAQAVVSGPSAFHRHPPTPQPRPRDTGETPVQLSPVGVGLGAPAQLAPSATPAHVPPPPSQDVQSSPILFHHWQPPTSQSGTMSGGNRPSTSPDHAASPRKRRAPPPAIPLNLQPLYTSPAFSVTGGSSKLDTPASVPRSHTRQLSDLTSRAPPEYRGVASSRPRSNEGSFLSHARASPSQGDDGKRSSGGANPVSALLTQSETRPRSQSERSLRRTYSERGTPDQEESRPSAKRKGLSRDS